MEKTKHSNLKEYLQKEEIKHSNLQKELLSFKKRCLEVFDIKEEDLKNQDNLVIRVELNNIKLSYTEVYLVYGFSRAFLGDCMNAFHITKRACNLYQISENDAFEYYGSRSYSFTNNKDLLDEIINSLKNGCYTIVEKTV